MRSILVTLHNVDFRLGWPRLTMATSLAAAVFVIGQWDQVRSPGQQAGDLLGPAIANAIDGETLYVGGTEVKLFGIDAVEDDQICQNSSGDDYACGRRATQALQSWCRRPRGLPAAFRHKRVPDSGKLRNHPGP